MSSHRYLVSFILVSLFAVIIGLSTANAAERMAQVRVDIKDKGELLTLRSLDLDEVFFDEKFVEVFASPEDLTLLQNSGLSFSVVHEDVTEFYRSRFDPSKDMGGYRTLSEIILVMDSIATANPTIVKAKWSIGNSYEGRPIYVMKISDNPNVDEIEPEVYYYSTHHAREVITPEVLIYAMRYLTNNYGTNPQVTYLVNNRELFFSPCMNPDGYYFNETETPGGGGLWRKNRKDNGNGTYGIDLNRNYGYNWGYDNEGSSPDPSSDTYRGTGPFSEPESQVESDFVESRNFAITLSFHSYSDLFIIPWGYNEIFCDDDETFEYMADTVGNMAAYSTGTAWQLLYSTNGSTDDWGYGETTTKNKNFAVTIEVGSQSDGFWPPTSRITTLVQKNINPILFLARIADNPGKLRTPRRPVIYSAPDITTTETDVYWSFSDAENPAQSFELYQLTGYSRGVDNLETTNTNWFNYNFASSTTRAHSGTKSFFSGNVSSLHAKMTATSSFKVNAGDSLKFWTWYNMENGWDYAYVEASTNGGANWATLSGNITTNTDPQGFNFGNGITGSSSNAWVEAKFPLTAYVGSEIIVRIRYVTDNGTNSGGIYIDDVSPVESFSGSLLVSGLSADTTFHLTGLTNGDYYYRVRAKDLENQYSLYSNTEKITVNQPPACTWIVGDADGNSNVTISDVVYMISYIFSGGAAPTPNAIGSGDADCNNMVTISDAVYLIQYIFSGGPQPGQTCDCTDYL